MNELHTMPVKVEKFMSSTNVQLLEMDELGAYFKLLCHAWLNKGLIEARIIEDTNVLQKFIKCSSNDVARYQSNVIQVFFTKDERGDYYNETLRHVYLDVMEKTQKVSAARRYAVAQRKGGKQAEKKTAIKCSSNDNQLIDIQSQSQSQSQIQNQIDINITDLEEKKIVPTSAEHSSKPATIPHWKRIYFDFDAQEWKGITAEDERNWKITYPACDINGELDKMHMWLISNPGRKKKNYAAFINNWLCRQQDRGGTK